MTFCLFISVKSCYNRMILEGFTIFASSCSRCAAVPSKEKAVIFMNTDQILYLAEINRSHTLQKASELLHITPQALSQSLIALEEELRLTLTKRSRNGTFLTREGLIVLEAGQEFLSVISELQNPAGFTQLKHLAHADLKILVSPGLLDTFLPKGISRLYLDYPSARIKLESMPVYEALRALNGGALDTELLMLSIYSYEGQILPDLRQYPMLNYQPITKSRYCCSVPENSEVVHYSSISIVNALRYPILLFTPTEELLLPLMQHFGKPSKLISVPNFSVFRQLLRDDKTSLTFSRQFRTFETMMTLDGRKLIPLKEDITISIGYVYRKDHTFSAAMQDFVSYLTNFYANQYGEY